MKNWNDDFNDFMTISEVRPPLAAGEEIFTLVHRDLNPTLLQVLGKLAAVHVVAGSLSLLLCVQFGMGRGYSLMNYFMRLGDVACFALCGAIFMGLTALVAGWILSAAEMKKIRSSAYSPIALLGLASLFVFFLFGAEIAFNTALIWLLGVLLAGVLVTEAHLGTRHRAAPSAR